jgi:hypothetical protein
MRKSTFAKIATLSMVPALFWSQDSFAVPAFARKYQTSCYTCHSGFPNRNAFGEAFKNNGYRWPGGEDEDHAKQEQTKMGANGWKQTFPETPWPSDIPGFAPFALYLTGPIVNYSDKVKDNTSALKTAQSLNWGGPVDARILFGGTVGESIGFVGALEGISAGATTTNVRAVWSFSPGVNLSFGNSGFSAFSGLASPISAYTNVFPARGVGPELNYVVGKEGGLNIIAGLSDITDAPNGTTLSVKDNDPTAGATLTTTKNLTAANKLDDIRYLRVKYKLFGAGLLSGAGGTYGNEYVGLDNSLAVGASLVSARDNMLSTGGGVERLVYGADIAGNYGSFTGGVAYSRDRDLGLNNYAVDAGYYIYPWLLPRVTYKYLSQVGGLDNPSIAASVTAYLRANVFLKASYSAFTHNIAPATASTTGVNNANTFTLTGGLAF